jgi:hypothetical protein
MTLPSARRGVVRVRGRWRVCSPSLEPLRRGAFSGGWFRSVRRVGRRTASQNAISVGVKASPRLPTLGSSPGAGGIFTEVGCAPRGVLGPHPRGAPPSRGSEKPVEHAATRSCNARKGEGATTRPAGGLPGSVGSAGWAQNSESTHRNWSHPQAPARSSLPDRKSFESAREQSCEPWVCLVTHRCGTRPCWAQEDRGAPPIGADRRRPCRWRSHSK